jgi:hypothetical protein
MRKILVYGIVVMMLGVIHPLGMENNAIAKPAYCREALRRCLVECGGSVFFQYGCEIGCGIGYLAC